MDNQLHFPPFRLDRRGGKLWRGDRSIALRPKTFALLDYLLAHAGKLLSKNELLTALWPDVNVHDAALTVCIHELRDALGDDAQACRFIETTHGRGYRFIAQVTATDPASVQGEDDVFVGRQEELAALSQTWRRVLKGATRVVFVCGEAGIGKTTLVQRFLAAAERPTASWTGRGQCVELYGESESYLPILEALGQMCRGRSGAEVRRVLLKYAPSWALEIPGLVAAADLPAVRLDSASAPLSRRLREFAEAIELLAAVRPVILVFEDLHLSDRATLELISYQARQGGEARVLIIGTARLQEERTRPVNDMIRDLNSRHQCELLELDALGQGAVADYLRRRIGNESVSLDLATQVFSRTEGNPLFMVTISDRLLEFDDGSRQVGADDLERIGVPDSLRDMIEKQFDMLADNDRRLIEAASVAGVEFPAANLRAALGQRRDGAIEPWEDRCDDLVRRGRFLRRRGITQWPDGTLSARYSFVHGLYQEVVYNRVNPARRARYHLRIGERMEAAYGTRAGDVAAELAAHFEKAGDNQRAVKYFGASVETELGRSAYDAAIAQARKALSLAGALPAGPQRSGEELRLRMLLGSALMARLGIAAPSVKQAYARAEELVERMDDTPALVPVLLGSAKFHIVRGELDAAQKFAERALRMAHHAQDPDLLLEARLVIGAILYSRGEFRDSLRHFEQAESLYDPARHRLHALTYGIEPGVLGKNYVAMNLWRLGFADRARKHATEAVALAEESGHAHSISLALTGLASIYERCRDWLSAAAWAEKLVNYAAEKELELWRAWGEVLLGTAQAELGDSRQGSMRIRSGLDSLEATGGSARQAEVAALETLVRAHALAEQEALHIATKALATARKTGELTDEAEMQRIIGSFRLAGGGAGNEAGHAEGEQSLLEAIETADRQNALAYKLRAEIVLARRRMQRGDRESVRTRLIESYRRFTEGFDTADLKEAKTLIEELQA